MLDTDTKRRIDTARDILVGKVPDPKSQVEQITIALIYKFMDDMDAEAEELGGKRKFFTANFARYGWAQLMRADLGGHEMLGLYAEGITKMPENPGIPPLFRDIFKNAYLPYRDPETLRAFLKIIDEFNYDHSERLGDAFEYLLSVLGSQGDAGQFRTPRHIIDFMVEVLNPTKNESVLDPACGTAGFLISAYKHILKTNSSPQAVGSKTIDENGKAALDTSRIPPSRGDLLTPDERGRLATNFKGYDISPDMVRLSLVNLYLHGFTDPHILEYDTLTSEERWNELADVILANPPFMSPKGGIKPHRRFSIQAKRSEVLFVDYMAEHLTPVGRAGIIVPEGIIFQTQTAYRDLRKMLVEKSLVAVVSLPSGCFNPYSGVKTSILILDKSLARQSDTVAFFKVENDGFGLGAQRRPIEKNDLPQVQAELTDYLQALRALQPTEDMQPTSGLIVPKEKIAANGDYNLNGERYRELAVGNNASFPRVRLGDACERIMDGTHFSPKSREQGEYRYITAKNIKEWGLALDDVTYLSKADHDEIYRRCPVKKGDVLYIKDGATTGVATINTLDEDFSLLSSVAVLRGKEGILDNRFLAHYLNSPIGKRHMLGMVSGVAITRLTLTKLNDAEMPLPPLEVQKEIVAEIEDYQNVINGARAVLDHYRPHIPVRPDWPMVKLDEITKPEYGFTEKAAEQGDARFIRITDISEDGKLRAAEPKFITLTEKARESLLRNGDILVARTGATFGKTMIFEGDAPAVFASFLIRLRFAKDRVHPRYYWVFAQSELYWNQAKALMTGGGQPQFNGNALKQVKIPLPPLATQQAIVTEIEAEQVLVQTDHSLRAKDSRDPSPYMG
jgi:type I restriction enzyme M protein